MCGVVLNQRNTDFLQGYFFQELQHGIHITFSTFQATGSSLRGDTIQAAGHVTGHVIQASDHVIVATVKALDVTAKPIVATGHGIRDTLQIVIHAT